MSDTPPNPLDGLLSDFALGPAWARAKSDSPKEKFKDSGEREYKPRRRDDQGGRDERNQRGGRDDRSGRRDDRRQGGGNRRDFKQGGRPDFRREEISPAEGVNVTLVPQKHAIQLVCKEVNQVARVYPLFDIAQIILAERNRSNAIFEIAEKKDPFYRCKFEDAIYLTKEEALQHFLQADWRNRFIEESTVEVEPPKGNFQSVAKCGISGEWLGPPNYHAYQTEIRRIHRERFSNMPFEAYLSKVRTERSEEAVNEWLESMKTQTRWRILSKEEAKQGRDGLSEPSASDVPLEENTPEQSPTASDSLPEQPDSEATLAEEPSEEPSEETPAPAPQSTPPADDTKWFTDRAEVERAIASEVLEKAFERTRKAKVSAAIAGKNLSPGLLVRLKGTGTHHRRHPAIIIPVVCKILEAEHMPVFKRKGKLYTGPARPQALAPDAILAPRPAEMVKWIRENTPAKLEGLWKAVLPEGATAPPAEYAADLFWLLQQGHILLYTDDTLVVQEQPKPQQPKKPKAPKKKPGRDASPQAPTSDTPPEEPSAALPPEPQPEAQQPREPLEIVTDAIEDTTKVVSDAASELIDAAVASVAPEAPTEPENPKEDPEPEAPSPTPEDPTKQSPTDH